MRQLTTVRGEKRPLSIITNIEAPFSNYRVRYNPLPQNPRWPSHFFFHFHSPLHFFHRYFQFFPAFVCLYTCIASFMEWRNLELDIEFECEFRYQMRLQVKPQVGLSCFSLWLFLCCCCCLFCHWRKDLLKNGVCFLAGEGGQEVSTSLLPFLAFSGRRPFFPGFLPLGYFSMGKS